MNKIILLFTILISSIQLLTAQVGIKTNNPKATLDIVATNLAAPGITTGILIPRIDTFPNMFPTADQNGMMVFLNLDNNFYYWNHSETSWINIKSGVQKIDDLEDGKSYSNSLYIGEDAGENDDGSNSTYNVGIGYNSLKIDTSGTQNTAIGAFSLAKNESGKENTAIGAFALFDNTDGDQNVAIGRLSLSNNISGINNTAAGNSSLWQNIDGNSNTAFGFSTLISNTSGDLNTSVGSSALSKNISGTANSAYGSSSLSKNTTGIQNTAYGSRSLYSNTVANYNTAIGNFSQEENITGTRNVSLGSLSLREDTLGNDNLALGYSAGENAMGSRNVFVGSKAGENSSLYSMSNSVFIGYEAGTNETNDDRLYISNSNTSTPLIYGEFDNQNLVINGKLGIGPGTPLANLHIVGSSTVARQLITTDSGLDGDSELVFAEDDDATFGLKFTYQGNGNKLFLRGFNTGYAVNNIPHLTVLRDNGRIGIKTESPTADLSVNGTANKTGSSTWATFSDARLKKDVTNYTEGLDFITKIRTVNFTYNDKMEEVWGKNESTKDKVYQGVIAQELKEIAPDMVNSVSLRSADIDDTETGASNNASSESFLEVDPNKFTYALINSVKELNEMVDELNSLVNKQQEQINQLLLAK